MDVASPLELRYSQQGHNLPGQPSAQSQIPSGVLRSPSTDGVVPTPIAPPMQPPTSPEKFQQSSQVAPVQPNANTTTTNTNGIGHPPLNAQPTPSVAPSFGTQSHSTNVHSQAPNESTAPPASSMNGSKIQQPSAIPRIRPSGIPRLSNLPRPMPSSPSFDLSHSNGHAPTLSPAPPSSGRAPSSASSSHYPISTPISPLSAPPHVENPLSGSSRPSLGHMDLATHNENYTRQYSGRSRAGVRSATNRGDRATSERAPRVITSKINSLKNVHHKPGGGNVAIVNEKVQLGPIKSKCNSFANVKHKPGGGNVTIVDEKIDMSSAHSRVGSLQNAKHVPAGGNVQIVTQKLDFDKNAKPKVGSMKNANHRPGGGDVQIFNESLPWLKYNKPNLPPDERARINKQRSTSHSGMNSSMHSGSTGS
ncbi:unnamed protein product [Echinostoma caproni]|uniref:Microtubule-associated protein n=1 Tax=Echinostoma caproni TaxID=27848 RepID=A0A183APS8_9TREM|nr:unnamed protein product [Echinostoma caproni]